MSNDRFIDRLTSWAHKPSEADRAHSLELAVSARRFSKRTQAVVDDKLSFSAALMRAGEVEAANRLLAEVGEEVLTEEVALLERVNEVKMARSIERDKLTRGRLARTLAVAMLGSSLLAFSAAGAAFVGLFRDEDQAIHGSDPGAAATRIAFERDDVNGGIRQVKLLDNVSLKMTAAQFRRYTQLTSGDINEDQLELFLLELLPPTLAQKVHYALVTGLQALPDAVGEQIVVAAHHLPSAKQESESSGEQTDTPAAGQSEEPKAEPTPEPSTTPGDDGTPAPEESPEDQNGIPLLDDDGEG